MSLARPATAAMPLGAAGSVLPLGPRLTLVSHAIRLAAVVWIAWALYAVVSYWTDTATFERGYGRLVGADISGASATQQYGALAIMLVDWALAALVAVSVWRLFGHFLAGRILDIRAVDEMRCVGAVGVASTIGDILARPLIAAVMSSHVASVAHRFPIWGQPNDLLHLLMAVFVLVLASVLRRGVVIPDEHRQIV